MMNWPNYWRDWTPLILSFSFWTKVQVLMITFRTRSLEDCGTWKRCGAVGTKQAERCSGTPSVMDVLVPPCGAIKCKLAWLWCRQFMYKWRQSLFCLAPAGSGRERVAWRGSQIKRHDTELSEIIRKTPLLPKYLTTYLCYILYLIMVPRWHRNVVPFLRLFSIVNRTT